MNVLLSLILAATGGALMVYGIREWLRRDERVHQDNEWTRAHSRFARRMNSARIHSSAIVFTALGAFLLVAGLANTVGGP